MKKTIIAVALGVATLGIMAGSPSQANAQWPTYYRTGYRVGGYGYMNTVSNPLLYVNVHPWGPAFGYSRQIYFAPAYRTVFTPYGQQTLYSSASSLSYTYSPWTGPVWQANSPAYYGPSYNSYMGAGIFYRPSITGVNSLYGAAVLPNYGLGAAWGTTPSVYMPVLGGTTFVLPLNATATVSTDSKTAEAYQNYVPAGYIKSAK
jgi:hypothetical protein